MIVMKITILSFYRQAHAYVDVDTHKNIPFLPEGSNVVLQHRDVGSLTQRTVVGHRSGEHNVRSYKIRMTKMG